MTDIWVVYSIAGIYLYGKQHIQSGFSPIIITASDLHVDFVFLIPVIFDCVVLEALVFTVITLWPVLQF